MVRYRDDGTPALGITLEIEPGQVVALVGPSVGKTTLANLLPLGRAHRRAACCWMGTTCPCAWSALQGPLALVSQDVVMFNDTLTTNVVLGSPRDAGGWQRAWTRRIWVGWWRSCPTGSSPWSATTP